MTSPRNLFSLFCSTWRAVLKMVVRLFWIKASESLDKNLARAIYKEEKWRKGERKSPLQLKQLEIFRDSMFCKMFSPLFCFVQENTSKNFSKKLYTSRLVPSRYLSVFSGERKLGFLGIRLRLQGGKTFCASFCASRIAGSRRAFLTVWLLEF